jgi:hypothetical protein
MFVSLLLALVTISLVLTTIVVVGFRKPIRGIMSRLLNDAHSEAWVQFLTFALYTVGVSSAIDRGQLQNYVTRRSGDDILAQVNVNTCLLEIYQTVESVLGGLAWSLMSFFTVALIAFIIVRSFELKREPKKDM